jgi:RND family efflux transporter MFP subunit
MQIRPTLRWFLLGLAGGALAGWFGARLLAGGEHEPAPRPRAPQAPEPAHTASVERVRLPDFELLPASLRSRRTAPLAAELQARVLRVARRAGERVAEGELLLELESDSLAAAREQAVQGVQAGEALLQSSRDAVALAQAVLEEARLHRERTETLLASGSATAEAAEQARSRHAAAQAGLAQSESGVRAAGAALAQARAALQAADVALARTRIAAPFAGVLSERTVEPGEIVTPGRTLLVLVDPAQLRAVAIAREELAGALRPGEQLEVEVPAAGATLAGVVEELAPRVDERSRALELRLLLDAPPSCLPGMYARVRLARPERELVLVPGAALSRVGQLATLRVRGSHGWGRRYVSVGATRADGRIEILAGLSGGETVGWDGE